MGRAPCCSRVGLHRGPWSPTEDALLLNYIQAHGEGRWRSLPERAGLLRCGKSCRLRWVNYLRPGIKRGNITPDEDDLIIRLHSLLGNRWSLIAGRLPGRTDNEIKNYWNTHLRKRFTRQGTNPTIDKLKNRNNNNNKKKKSKSSLSENLKVHLPKPFRATTTVSSSFEFEQCNTIFASFLVDDDHEHDFVDGSDHFDCLFHEDDSSSLEKLYEEYLQILKTNDDESVQVDSFDESNY